MKIGTVIKNIRNDKGLKQKFVAAKADISPVFLSQIEADSKLPSMQTLKAISEVLGVPMALLLLKSLEIEKDIEPTLQKSYKKIEKILSEITQDF